MPFPAFGSHAVSPEQFDHRLFDQAHHAAHGQAAPRQIDERIHDRLSRAVVGDLPAAVDPFDGHFTAPGEMFGPAGDPDRIDGRMLEHPELVGRLRFALIGKPTHRLVGRRVLGEA
jgi:hypothetical protein